MMSVRGEFGKAAINTHGKRQEKSYTGFRDLENEARYREIKGKPKDTNPDKAILCTKEKGKSKEDHVLKAS